jgi:glucose/arabinose dehydrogenase
LIVVSDLLYSVTAMTNKVAQAIRFASFLLTAVLETLLPSHYTYGEELPLKDIKLPAGFEISVYRNQIFIAEHGSWNRSKPIGYRVSLVELNGNRAISYKVFAEGWLRGSQAWGRPVDVQVMPDGAMLISDDQAGALYRISYKK